MLLHLLEPFNDAMAQDDTREIVVNRLGQFGVEGDDGWRWYDDERITFDRLDAIGLLAMHATGQDFGPENPSGSSRLPGRQRVTVMRPPLAEPDTISLTIRQRAKSFRPRLPWLRDRGFFSFLDPSVDWVERLTRWVAVDRLNIEIVAATGGGKTTLQEALCWEIPEEERVITVESAPELLLPHRNWLPVLYAQEGQGKNRSPTAAIELALRQRPDRIIFGEKRTGEALNYLNALNSGHRGGISTMHGDPGWQGMEDAMVGMIRRNPASAGMQQADIERMLRRTIHVLICVERVVGHPIPFRATMIERRGE